MGGLTIYRQYFVLVACLQHSVLAVLMLKLSVTEWANNVNVVKIIEKQNWKGFCFKVGLHVQI